MSRIQIDNEKIKCFPTFFFDFLNLKSCVQLYLNVPNLGIVRKSDFVEFKNLKCLTIIANNLTIIEENSFNRLLKLENFYLEANSLMKIPDKLMNKLTVLQNITLIVEKIFYIPEKVFKKNISFNSFRIYSMCLCAPAFLNVIKKIEIFHFIIKVLQSPNIHTNLLLNIKILKINRITVTQNYEISAANLTALHIFDSIFEGQHFENVFKSCHLKTITINRNYINSNYFQLTLKLAFNSLTYLNLSQNNITKIGRNSFINFHHLLILNLSCNKLKIIDKYLFQGLINLMVLNLYQNGICRIESDSFKDLPNLEILNLDSNLINNNYYSRIYLVNKNLTKLYLNSNVLHSLDYMFSEHITFKFIEILDFQKNHIQNIQDDFFIILKHLQYLYLNDNSIRCLNRNHFANLHFLEYLDLSNNCIWYLDSELFHNLFHLKTLKLSENFIESVPNDLFKKLSSLQVLDLSYNAITMVSDTIFSYNPKLNYLYLNHNKLIYMGKNVFKYSYVQCVNLAANTFRSFSPSVIINNTCSYCCYIIDLSLQDILTDYNVLETFKFIIEE